MILHMVLVMHLLMRFASLATVVFAVARENFPAFVLSRKILILCIFIMMGDSMILSEPDDTHMTVFNQDEKLLDLIKIISRGEGLYVWKH